MSDYTFTADDLRDYQKDLLLRISYLSSGTPAGCLPGLYREILVKQLLTETYIVDVDLC